MYQLRLIARQRYAKLVRLADETRNDRSLGKERYNQARAYTGMSEGVAWLAAWLLNDEDILDDPGANL